MSNIPKTTENQSNLVVQFLKDQAKIRQELLTYYDSLINDILKIMGNSEKLSEQQEENIGYLIEQAINDYDYNTNIIMSQLNDILNIKYEN
ncbi:hypothetical protein [Candidatus Phytoplasma pruni]|uniref:Uncharacterized protein n=1 Tax=Candidatus Phytoplasma pruni TaxID=479893 RepID=A0A851HAQ2_9MOLU|nr:hypothetical protein [Candidatus Phytoplasma pruni]NWN45987.1 hypothetical protein [Candidatus Phytoplasma pruni]